MNEATTAMTYIDPALSAAGWGVVEGSRVVREFGITQGRLEGQGRRSKPLKADYILIYKNRILGVIEAKARDKGYTEGVGQAKDYAQRLQVRYTFSTNGERIYQIDMKRGQEGEVDRYPGPDELWAMTFAQPNNWRDRFQEIPFEDRSGTWQPRYYQQNAINNVLDALANGQTRLLLTLATGTGKTAIAFQIAWKLFHSRWNLSALTEDYHPRAPRILFLADRNILADQAFNAFSAFEEDALVRIRPDEIARRGRVPKHGSIFFTIFQTFMSGPGDTPYFGEYPEDYFDFIIIDECHRGGANDESTWRAIMEYFSPAVQLGLTATPRRDVNKDTYRYFGDPVYVYALKEGINDGFLTPFKVKEFSTTIDEYTYTSDDMVEAGMVGQGDQFKEEDFNRIIEIKAREKYRVKLFLHEANPKQKTLIFCATQLHAAAIRDLINQLSDSEDPNYCHRVTANDGKIGEQHLRDFQDNEKSIPTILTTSQKLSTGVDAPEVRNIVLFRPVKSMVEFKQIIGRGTRLYDGKDYFTIYDFVKAHQHFEDPEWDGPPLPPEEGEPAGPREPCPACGNRPCTCEKAPETCPNCGYIDCICEREPRRMIRITLADHKVRELDSMVKTSFWSPEGKPISAEKFIQMLFGDIPSLFRDEAELRQLWSQPDTRQKLLEALSEKGYSQNQLEDLQKLVHGQDSDLYDVLAYVAYHRDMVPRLERAERARIHFDSYNSAQQEFLNFVLDQYVAAGVRELSDEKLPDILELKYGGVRDAKIKLGGIGNIRNTFIGFQRYLYEGEVG